MQQNRAKQTTNYTKDRFQGNKSNIELTEVSTSREANYRQSEEDIVMKDASENLSKVEDFRTLKIATHNINGIKGNLVKLESLLDWAKTNDIDMLRINETNTTKRQNHFTINNQKEYKGIWTDAEENKKKSFEVSLIMSKK